MAGGGPAGGVHQIDCGADGRGARLPPAGGSAFVPPAGGCRWVTHQGRLAPGCRAGPVLRVNPPGSAGGIHPRSDRVNAPGPRTRDHPD